MESIEILPELVYSINKGEISMFVYDNFCHGASNDRAQNQSAIFLYKTVDTLQQMTTAGYFNRAKLDLHIGDIIFATVESIKETTSYDTYVFRVLTVNEPITVEQISLGTVASVNGVQPVDGNVEITGDNITATVGEEEATITQHLTALKNDDAELGEQVSDVQGDVNTLKSDSWPTSSDYSPVNITLEPNTFQDYYLSCNLGALTDGVYEFYFRFIDNIQNPAQPYPSVSDWQQYFVHLTIKNGEVFGLNSGANNDTYFAPVANTDNIGNANSYYGSSTNDNLYCGKSGNNFYVEGFNQICGVSVVNNWTEEQFVATPVYITKIKNVNTGEYIDFANVALVDTTTSHTVNDMISSINPNGSNVIDMIRQHFTTYGNLWNPLDCKYLQIYFANTLTNRPLTANTPTALNSFAKKATVCFYTTPQSDDYLEFDVYGSPTQVKISNVRKGGIFSDVVFANYYDTNDNDAGYLYLSKADGTNFQNTSGMCGCISWYGQSNQQNGIYEENEIPTERTFIENLTPEGMAATVSSNVFTENLGNNIVRISGTESFGTLAQQATTEHPITLPVALADANYVVQTTATSAAGMCEIVSGFAARTSTGFNISVRNLATEAEATDVAVCWTIIGQKA